MQTDIHPKYAELVVKCTCGNTFSTQSTRSGNLSVELCNECHPYYTGKQKLVDSGGRIDRFGICCHAICGPVLGLHNGRIFP